MRDSAGQLLGAMCGRLGTAVYEEVRAPALELIRSNLERSEEVSRVVNQCKPMRVDFVRNVW